METFEGRKEGDAFTTHLLLESLALKPSSVSPPLRELGHAAAAGTDEDVWLRVHDKFAGREKLAES